MVRSFSGALRRGSLEINLVVLAAGLVVQLGNAGMQAVDVGLLGVVGADVKDLDGQAFLEVLEAQLVDRG